MKQILFVAILIVYVQANWQQTFAQEFNGQTKLDTTIWNVFYSSTPYIMNDELEWYSPGSFNFTDTTLQIIGATASFNTSVGWRNYTSGVITSLHKFYQKFGYWEMRSQHPVGNGFWPAFWLMPEDGTTAMEMDIMEQIMSQPDTVYTTFHCNYTSDGASGSYATNSTYGSGFHVYGLQWIPGHLYWYIDGELVFSIQSGCIANRPAYILANMAIGGTWPGPPTNSSLFPVTMDIDYIRVYEYVSTGGVTLPGPGAGISYTDISDPEPLFYIGLVTCTPETAAQGTIINVTAGIRSVSAALNLTLWFSFSNDTTYLGYVTVDLTVPAGTLGNASVTWTIPEAQPDGYIRVSLGVFNSTGGQYVWEDDVAAIGVNEVVGGQDIQTTTSTATSGGSATSSTSSSTGAAIDGIITLYTTTTGEGAPAVVNDGSQIQIFAGLVVALLITCL